MRPIIILGAARSGTTLLAEHILSKHSQIIYWNEPSFVWKAGFAYRADDLIGPAEVSENYSGLVRTIFGRRMLNANSLMRFMEKTPSNCLRVESILKIFPDAQFVHVIRDGRAVALSAHKEWRGISGDSLDSLSIRRKSGMPKLVELFRRESDLSMRFSSWRTIFDLPAYFFRFLTAVYRQVLHPSRLLWGPRIPGLEQIRRSFSLIETCALQWEVCVHAARSSGRNLQASQYLEVFYEDLLEHPLAQIERIVGFLGLEPFSDREMDSFVDAVQNRSNLWKDRYSCEELRTVERCIGLSLEELGYINRPDKTELPELKKNDRKEC